MKFSQLTLRVLLGVLCLLGITLLYVPSELPTNDWLRMGLLIARALLLVLVPGGLILSCFHHEYEPDEALAFAPILSLALFPLTLLLCTTAGLALSANALRVVLAVGLICLAVRIIHRIEDVELHFTPKLASVLSLGLIFFGALLLRLYQIRGIAYPAGGDSYHHTLITQLIMMFGQVPDSYEPLVDISSFTYHFGYHTYSAFLGWIGDLEPHRAVLWGGQFLNALTVPSVWFLTKRISHSRRAAVAASVMAGLVCMMPAHYVNWGRYAQLMGQVVLLPALGVLLDALKPGRISWWLIGLTAVMGAGVGLCHYRVAIFYLVGALIVAIAAFIRVSSSQRLHILFEVVLISAIALALMSPWLPSFLHKTVSAAEEVTARADTSQYDYLTLDFILGMGLQPAVIIASILSSLWLLVRKTYRVQTIGILIWVVIVWFLANSDFSSIPNGFLTNGTLVLALYLPTSLLIGLALADMSRLIAPHFGGQSIGLVALGTIVCLWGALGIRDKLNWGIDRGMFWVTNGDLAAMTWIEENTVPEASFSIAMNYWQTEHIGAVDGGYWIEYVTGRHILVPPLVYINEMTVSQIASIDKIGLALLEADDVSEYAQAMRNANLDYVYEHLDSPILADDEFFHSDLFELVYENDTVAIYALN